MNHLCINRSILHWKVSFVSINFHLSMELAAIFPFCFKWFALTIYSQPFTLRKWLFRKLPPFKVLKNLFVSFIPFRTAGSLYCWIEVLFWELHCQILHFWIVFNNSRRGWNTVISWKISNSTWLDYRMCDFWQKKIWEFLIDIYT